MRDLQNMCFVIAYDSDRFVDGRLSISGQNKLNDTRYAPLDINRPIKTYV